MILFALVNGYIRGQYDIAINIQRNNNNFIYNIFTGESKVHVETTSRQLVLTWSQNEASEQRTKSAIISFDDGPQECILKTYTKYSFHYEGIKYFQYFTLIVFLSMYDNIYILNSIIYYIFPERDENNDLMELTFVEGQSKMPPYKLKFPGELEFKADVNYIMEIKNK